MSRLISLPESLSGFYSHIKDCACMKILVLNQYLRADGIKLVSFACLLVFRVG